MINEYESHTSKLILNQNKLDKPVRQKNFLITFIFQMSCRLHE